MHFEIFETDRLLLKIFTPAHFIYVFENHEPEEIRNLLGIETDEEYFAEENKYKNGYASHDRTIVYFQLIDKTTGNILGAAGFHNFYPKHARAELGYALKKDEYKGQGLMTEALNFIIDYGFTSLQLNRIEAFVGPENLPSLKLVAKYKFFSEGHLRQHYFVNGKLDDSLIFGLLREEYFANKNS